MEVELRLNRSCVALSGLFSYLNPFPGLTPWALLFRPFGAEYSECHPMRVLPMCPVGHCPALSARTSPEGAKQQSPGWSEAKPWDS